MNNLTVVETKESMSSTQLAELLGKKKSHINEAIRKMFTKEIDDRDFRPSLDSRGYVDNYYLPEIETHMFVAKYDHTHLRKLANYWVERKAPVTLSLEEMTLQVIQGQQTKILELEEQSRVDAPKIKFAMAVRNMEGACSISDFAKATGTGRNRFYDKLRSDSIMMPSNRPYQRFIDRGLFIVIEQVPYTDNKGKAHPSFKTMITGKGQVWLESKYRPEQIIREALKVINKEKKNEQISTTKTAVRFSRKLGNICWTKL